MSLKNLPIRINQNLDLKSKLAIICKPETLFTGVKSNHTTLNVFSQLPELLVTS